MKKVKVKKLFDDFMFTYDLEESKEVWRNQSTIFRKFWKEKILDKSYKLKIEEDLIPIIQILDIKGFGGKGKKDRYEGVAFTNIFQNVWYDIFTNIKKDEEIRGMLDRLLNGKKDEILISILDNLYKINQTKKIQALTGENAVVINDFLFAYNPTDNVSMISLADRYKVIDFFDLGNLKLIDKLSYGNKIIETRNLVISFKEKYELEITNKGLSEFFYFEPMKVLWKPKRKISEEKKKTKNKQQFLKVDRKGPWIGEAINFRGMDYAPVEENGVIFLFSKITEDIGIKIISIQKHFPDALGIKYEPDGKGYQIHIEFEYKSSEFVRHGHLKKMKKGIQCNLIVCWEHDWEDCPTEIQVIELRRLIKELPSQED